MFSVGTAILITLVAVAGCVTCLLLVRHRKQSQKRGSAQSPPADKGIMVEVETSADGPTPPPAEPVGRAGSEPCLASGAEPLASDQQTCDVLEITETIAPEVQPTHPQETARPEVERDFTEVPATGILDIEQETIPPSVEAHRDSETVQELSAEQLAGSDFESAVGRPAVPIEEAQPQADKAPSTNGLQKVETAGNPREESDNGLRQANAKLDDTDHHVSAGRND